MKSKLFAIKKLTDVTDKDLLIEGFKDNFNHKSIASWTCNLNEVNHEFTITLFLNRLTDEKTIKKWFPETIIEALEEPSKELKEEINEIIENKIEIEIAKTQENIKETKNEIQSTNHDKIENNNASAIENTVEAKTEPEPEPVKEPELKEVKDTVAAEDEVAKEREPIFKIRKNTKLDKPFILYVNENKENPEDIIKLLDDNSFGLKIYEVNLQNWFKLSRDDVNVVIYRDFRPETLNTVLFSKLWNPYPNAINVIIAKKTPEEYFKDFPGSTKNIYLMTKCEKPAEKSKSYEFTLPDRIRAKFTQKLKSKPNFDKFTTHLNH